jgi:hypothetical protein
MRIDKNLMRPRAFQRNSTNEDLLNIKSRTLSRTSDTTETQNLCVIKVILLACFTYIVDTVSQKLKKVKGVRPQIRLQQWNLLSYCSSVYFLKFNNKQQWKVNEI